MKTLSAAASVLALLAAAPAWAANPASAPNGSVAYHSGSSGANSGNANANAANSSGNPANGEQNSASTTSGSGSAAGTNTSSAAAASNAPSSGTSKLSKQDRDFMQSALSSGIAEVQEGQAALAHSRDLAVQEFGRWMVTDHSLLDSMIQKRAEAADVTLKPVLTAHQTAQAAKLETLPGPQFTKHYVLAQVTAHQKAVQLYQQEVNDGKSPAIRGLAKLGLGVLKQHLAEAQELQSALPSIMAALSR